MVDKDKFYDIEGISSIVTDSNKAADSPPTSNVAKDIRVKAPLLAIKTTQGEIKMAEVDTTMLASQHSDIRREQAEQTSTIRREAAEHTNEIVKEGLKATAITDAAVANSRYEVNSRIDHAASRADNQFAALSDRFFTVARDTADLRAQVIQAIDTTKMASEMAALKGIIEGQKNTTYLSDKIGDEAEKTRALINDLKYHDLNRGLIERNAALVEEVSERRHWRHAADQGQWQALNSQLQAFQSQLQETRQGMVNFGTMAGVGQSSTSNNVR